VTAGCGTYRVVVFPGRVVVCPGRVVVTVRVGPDFVAVVKFVLTVSYR